MVSGPVFSITCLPTRAEGGIDGRVVRVAGLASQHAARAELGPEVRILRIVGVLRLFLGVEVIEIAEELVEAVHRRQMFVAVAEMVLAELAGGVAEGLQDVRDARDPAALKSEFAPGRPTLVSPVRIGDCPVMKAARPAVQLCWPYQSVNSAPSLAMRSMLGVR